MIIFCIVFGLISVTISLIALTYADKISQYLCSAITVCFGAFMVYTGFILSDGQNIRIRIISYNDYIYYHKMTDGEVVDFKPIGLVLK